MDATIDALEDASLNDAPRQSPSFVASLPGGDICVTDAMTHELHILSLTGERRGTICASPALQFPMGLAWNSGFLYIADGHSDSVSKIDITDGRTLACARGLQYPHGVAYSEGRVFVCDCFNHRLVIYDSDLLELRVIGRRGSSHGEFMFPRGVAVNANEVSSR